MPSGTYKRTKEYKRKMNLALKGKEKSKKTKKKMSLAHEGNKLSKKTRLKISKALMKNLNGWKSDKDIKAHSWIKRKLGEPMYCEICKRTDKKRYDWTNKNHKYKKVLKDWQRLCRSCHTKWDFKYNNRNKRYDRKSIKNNPAKSHK